jgi:cytochrome d ubiquinol oxidase subunit II
METLWFVLVALMLAAYVIFDGFDLGAGAVHHFVARTQAERRLVIRSIGPVWDGNEVWLLATGGTLYFAFPALYAVAFSGFYLPLMIVLWLLIVRGAALEFRNHLQHPVWIPFWDAAFALASTLLAVFFGAALGNVVRGVPFDGSGRFFAPLWTHFGPRGTTGVLDWYTITAGVAALSALALHGSLWIALKTPAPVCERARRAARLLWVSTAGLTLLLTGLTLALQPLVRDNLSRRPWGWGFPALALGGMAVVWSGLRAGRDLRGFLGSCAYLAGMMSSAAFGLFPYVLPSSTDPLLGMTAEQAAAHDCGLRAGLAWWIPGMALVAVYFVFTYRRLAGRVEAPPGGAVAGE